MTLGGLRGAAVALATVLVVAGCGSAEEPDDRPTTAPPSETTTSGTALEQALAVTPASDDAATWWAFSDVAALESADGVDDPAGVTSQASAFGYGSLAPYLRHLADYAPSATSDEAVAVSFGTAPNEGFRFTGVENAEEVYGAIEGEREELADGTLLVRRGDHEIDMNDETFGVPLTTQMNVIWYRDETVIAGSSRALVESAVAESQASLLDAPDYAGITDCLGDVAAGLLASDQLSATDNVGVGLRLDDGDPVEVLCVRSDDAASQAIQIEEAIASGADPQSGRPWAKLLGETEIDTSGEWVRIVATAPGSPMIFYRLLVNRALPALVGSDQN